MGKVDEETMDVNTEDRIVNGSDGGRTGKFESLNMLRVKQVSEFNM